jgi:predicted SnoaL-like aldol condensation-catalyzing enzyme
MRKWLLIVLPISALSFIMGVLWAPQTIQVPSPPSTVFGETTKANKKAALEYYDLAINKKDYEAASEYLGPTYNQHNPLVDDGKEGFRAFLTMLKKDYPLAHSEVKRVFADGEYVILHVHSLRLPNTLGGAIFDCFRFENRKIVEHWDSIQEIPEKSANRNGMF